MTLRDIDPAFNLLAEFGKATKGTTKQLGAMRQAAIFSDGAVPARLKALTAVLWSISARCEPCIAFYMEEAVKRGAGEDEIGEILAVASVMGGCVGEMWALKAYKAYRDCLAGNKERSEPSCCGGHG